jgi:hypothetical protein
MATISIMNIISLKSNVETSSTLFKKTIHKIYPISEPTTQIIETILRRLSSDKLMQYSVTIKTLKHMVYS